MEWVAVGDGYTARLRGEGARTELVCRSPKGRDLVRVPASLGKDEGIVALRSLRARLAEHEDQVRAQVRTWVSRSLPVPAALLVAVWSDPVWRRALTRLVVVPEADGSGTTEPGLLVDADARHGVELVDLNGTRSRVSGASFTLPHPLRLGVDLGAWRALADAHDTSYGSPQLDHPVRRRPDGFDPEAVSVGLRPSSIYDLGSTFERRVNRLGGRIRGETAYFQVYGADHRAGPIPVSLGLRWQGPDSAVNVNDLAWHVPAGSVDDVAWSEGLHILMELYRQRSTDDSDDGPEPEQVPGMEYLTGDAPMAVVSPAPDERTALTRAEGVALSPAREGEDALVALDLSHPALDGPVVMLVPEHSVEARRVVWQDLGLTSRSESKVGARGHRPPEFLAAVLAHRPEGMEQAVALLPRLRRQSEVARTKPGRARKALDETADELTRTAPDLLPFFYDECAQILVEAGNTGYATGFHDQARMAERAFDDVDEDAVIESYVSFPLPDALPRSLSTHDKALAQRLEPGEAYRWHRDLVIAWCEEGRRASKHLASGLVALAAAAEIVPGGSGTDDGEADARAVRALLTNGSLVLAPAKVWTPLLPLLRSMVAEDPRVGGLLATRIPVPSGTSAKAKTTAARLWARVLRETRVEAPFGEESGLDAVAVKRWADAFIRRYAGMALPADELGEPLRAAGAVLRAAGMEADGAPLLSLRSWREPQSLGVLDLLVSSGVPVSGHWDVDTEPPWRDGGPIFLSSWLVWAPEPHDLPALAADPLWRRALRVAIEGPARFDATSGFGRSKGAPIPEDADLHARQIRDYMARCAGALVRTPGITDVVDEILADHSERLDRFVSPGLPEVYAALRSVERFLAQDPPERVVERAEPILSRVDPVESLAVTLRGGVTDELFLPALEEMPENPASCLLEECGPDLYLLHETPDRHSSLSMRRVRPDHLEPVLTTRSRSKQERRWCSVCLAALLEGAEPVEDCAHERAEATEERIHFPGSGEITVRRVGRVRQELLDAQGRVLAAHRIGRSGASGPMDVREYCHRYAAGTLLVPPPGWWRHTRVRDERGSAALRAVDTGLAKDLLDAVTSDLGRRIVSATDRAEPRDSRLPERDQCVAELAAIVHSFLPAITEERLLKGVIALVWTAVECRERAMTLESFLKSTR